MTDIDHLLTQIRHLPLDPRLAQIDQAVFAGLAAIARLPSPLKAMLVLHTIEDMSQSDVAHILSISEKAVETRLYRARKHLNQALAKGKVAELSA